MCDFQILLTGHFCMYMNGSYLFVIMERCYFKVNSLSQCKILCFRLDYKENANIQLKPETEVIGEYI